MKQDLWLSGELEIATHPELEAEKMSANYWIKRITSTRFAS
ncbi:hypothetical protein [Algoriphagus sp. A40]|nr:hypothetical protein [Algoriphagus sp. A40]